VLVIKQGKTIYGVCAYIKTSLLNNEMNSIIISGQYMVFHGQLMKRK
jgi:hypothetical protein